MEAQINQVSSNLPDFSSHADPVKKDVDAPAFSKALQKAEKKEVAPLKKASQPVRSQALKASAPPQEEIRSENQSEVPVAMSADPKAAFKESPKEDEGNQKNVIQDDKKGLVAKSYDGMVVSYPVSRIAKESLDEKTLKLLDDQGLSNLPTLIMAQPSQGFQAMKNVTAESAVPVAKPIAQFMASLENELGVKPDRLVQAFKKLPLGQLALPPQETMAQVVKNLNLNAADQAKAGELFTKMLAQMQSVQNEMTPMIVPAVAGTGVVAVQSSEKAEENGVVTKNKAQTAVARYVQNSGGTSLEKGSDVEKSTSAVDGVNSQTKEAPLASDLKNYQQPRESHGQQTTAPKEVAGQQSATQAQGQQQVQPQVQSVPAPVVAEAQPALANPQVQSQAVVAANPAVVKEQTKDEKPDWKPARTVDSKVDVKHVSAMDTTQVDAAPAKPAASPQAIDLGTGGVAAGELKAGQDSKHEAIRSIINNAQMLAAKGGGEMRMTLKPDHLGEIQLKVAMEGNRVNVQMTAERGEVKKLIEQNVHELRHGLASHNLSMEKLDVSVANKDASGFTKGQPDFGAARDFAQQFHQNQSSKREFMENLSSLRSNPMKSMQTIDRSAQVQGARASSRSGRLNVMA